MTVCITINSLPATGSLLEKMHTVTHVLAEDTLHGFEACLHGSINHDHFNHSETLCVSFPYLVSSPCHFVLNICIYVTVQF